MRRNLCGGSPARELPKGKWPKNLTVFVLAKEPLLRGDRLHYPFGDGEEPGEVAACGIMMVWPICNFRSFSM
jgi:hypothetical protein